MRRFSQTFLYHAKKSCCFRLDCVKQRCKNIEVAPFTHKIEYHAIANHAKPPSVFQPQTVACNTSPESVARCSASITTMPADCSCPIPTTPFVSAQRGTFAEYNTPHAQIQVIFFGHPITCSKAYIKYIFSPVNTPAMSFSITGGTPAEGSKVGTSCSTDWITIPCATNSNDPTTQTGTPSVCVDRICGMVFNSAVTPSSSASKPVTSRSF